MSASTPFSSVNTSSSGSVSRARAVLVTGAAKRIGRGVALEFARQGWDVVVHYGHSAHEARETVADIESLGRRAVALKADLAVEAEVERLVPACAEAFGGLNCVVNCASRFDEDTAIDFGYAKLLEMTAVNVAAPLTLAAAATAASFFSFLPTAYRGVSEVGLIAGVGMFVAYATNMTLLPALIKVFAPPGEAQSPGFPVLAPVDEFLDRHRKPVLIGTLVIVIGALPLLFNLRFDFNPLHLKDPHTESMATLISLQDSPEGAVNDVAVLAPSLADADAIAAKL